MRIALIVFFLLLTNLFHISCTDAQPLPGNYNLVTNGSFEFATCGYSRTNDSTFTNNPSCWISANRASSGFLCPSIFYPDFNTGARSGQGAFILFRGFSKRQLSTGIWIDTPDGYRTYAETRLLEPLITGKSYQVKFYFGAFLDTAAPTRTHTHNQDIVSNVGVYFSNNVLRDATTWGQIKVAPQLNFTSHMLPYLDSFMYIELSGTYVAKGGERYMTIGNFDDLEQFVFMHITKSSQMYGVTTPYMNSVFIDDVSVVSDTTQPTISLDHFSLGNDTTLCAGDSMRIGGELYFFHYWWNTGDTTRFITIDTPGTYWCTVDYGCSNYTDTIHIYPPLKPFSLNDTLRLCNGQLPYVYRLPAISGSNPLAQYHWSDGSRADSLIIRSAGSYTLYRSDACGTVSDAINLSVHLAAPVSPGYLPDTTLCSGDSITLSAGAGYHQYLWSSGDTTRSIVVRHAGMYRVSASGLCDTLLDSSRISTLDPPPAFSLGNDTNVCPHTELTLAAPTGLYSIRWHPAGETTSSITTDFNGLFSATLSNRCGKTSDTVAIGWLDLPGPGRIIFGDTDLCKEGRLTAGWLYNHSVFSKKWSTGDTSSQIQIRRPGMYSLQLSNLCGSYEDSVYVYGCKGIIAFPNAFSPNGDGHNDVFRPIIQDRMLIDEFMIRIYNRWGQSVFVSGTAAEGWDGSGHPSGTYFYQCRYKERGKTEQFLKGSLELIR